MPVHQMLQPTVTTYLLLDIDQIATVAYIQHLLLYMSEEFGQRVGGCHPYFRSHLLMPQVSKSHRIKSLPLSR